MVLDGVSRDESFAHDLNPKDIDRIKPGMKVRPVWAEKRMGDLQGSPVFRDCRLKEERYQCKYLMKIEKDCKVMTGKMALPNHYFCREAGFKIHHCTQGRK